MKRIKIEDVDLRKVGKRERQIRKLKISPIRTLDFVYGEAQPEAVPAAVRRSTAGGSTSGSTGQRPVPAKSRYGGECEVTYEYPELTALCPMTGIQDLYTVRIIYIPKDRIPELKSLRFYLLSYRDIAILHEHLANKIFSDFKKAVRPKRLRLELEVAIRGGIKTKIVKQF